MTTLRGLSLFFVIAALLVSKTARADFHFELTPAEIRPGGHAELLVTVPKTKPSDELPLQLQDELLSQNKELVVLEKDLQEKSDHYELKYVLTTHKTGVFSVPPIEMRLGPDSYSTQLLALKSSSTRAEGDSEIRPEFGDLPFPVPWTRYLGFFLGAVLLFALIRFGVKKIKLPKPAPKKPAPIPEEDPLLWLRRNLDQFFKTLTPEELFPSRKADELVQIVREYFARATKSPVQAWTLAEFQKKLAKDQAAQEISLRFREWEWLRFKKQNPESRLPLQNVAQEIEKVLLP